MPDGWGKVVGMNMAAEMVKLRSQPLGYAPQHAPWRSWLYSEAAKS